MRNTILMALGLAICASVYEPAVAGMQAVDEVHEEDSMARNFTAGTIVQRARERSDQMSWNFIESSEALRMLSAMYGAYYDMILQHEPDQIALVEPSYEWTASSAARYAMPADFYSLLGVQRLVGGNQWVNLERYQVQEEEDLGQTPADAYWYRLDGNYIRLRPNPPGGTYRAKYWGAPADIVAEATVIDGAGGWEELLVRELAVAFAGKEGVPATIAYHQKERDNFKNELLARLNNRQPATTHTVRDVYAPKGYRPGDWERQGLRTLDD